MALYRGGLEPSAIYRGTVPVKKIMRGTIEVWSATSPSVYPVSGTWNSAITSSATTYASHTIAEDGAYTITHTVTGGGMYMTALIDGPWGSTTGPFGPPSTATTTQTLAAGDLIEFRAGALIPSGAAFGSWSIVKN